MQSQLVGYRWRVTKTKTASLGKVNDGFQSQGRCRKHVNTKHIWFFYFDGKPNSKEITDSLNVASNFPIESTIQDQTRETTKHAVKLLPSFSLSCDIGEVFTKWLTGRKIVQPSRLLQDALSFLDFAVKTRKS